MVQPAFSPNEVVENVQFFVVELGTPFQYANDLPSDFRTSDKLRDWLPISEGAMRKGRFTEEQMVAIVREADREPVPAVAKRHGVSEQTIYTWRKRFGSFQASDVRRLRQLEAENARLKKLVVERDLEIEVMKEVAAKNW